MCFIIRGVFHKRGKGLHTRKHRCMEGWKDGRTYTTRPNQMEEFEVIRQQAPSNYVLYEVAKCMCIMNLVHPHRSCVTGRVWTSVGSWQRSVVHFRSLDELNSSVQPSTLKPKTVRLGTGEPKMRDHKHPKPFPE